MCFPSEIRFRIRCTLKILNNIFLMYIVIILRWLTLVGQIVEWSIVVKWIYLKWLQNVNLISRYVIYWLTIWMTWICTDMRKLFNINWFFAPNHSTMRQKQHNIFYACLTFSVTEDVFSAICFHHDLSRCSIMVKWDYNVKLELRP